MCIRDSVVTIDDMTSLILAEKHAAWSDIAKKIAHEVKNPLTPIKLAAERIEKKIIEKSINFKDINNLTQTISKQVDGIGKLVDEFPGPTTQLLLPNPSSAEEVEPPKFSPKLCPFLYSFSYKILSSSASPPV